MPAYSIATATPDQSGICDLHHSSQQHWILNPLSGGQGSNPCPHGHQLGSFPRSHNGNAYPQDFKNIIPLPLISSSAIGKSALTGRLFAEVRVGSGGRLINLQKPSLQACSETMQWSVSVQVIFFIYFTGHSTDLFTEKIMSFRSENGFNSCISFSGTPRRSLHSGFLL